MIIHSLQHTKSHHCCCSCSAAAVAAAALLLQLLLLLLCCCSCCSCCSAAAAAAAAGLCSAVRCLCCVVPAAVRAWISERAGKRANERADEQANGRRKASEAAVGKPSGWALSGTPHTAHDCSGWDGLGYERYSKASERVEVLGAACGSGSVVHVCRGPGYVVVSRASNGTPVAWEPSQPQARLQRTGCPS